MDTETNIGESQHGISESILSFVEPESTLTFVDKTERIDISSMPDVSSSSVCLVLYCRDGVEVVPLSKGEPLILGRSWPSTSMRWDKQLSRQHAQFLWDDLGVSLRDLSSTNGTFLNGARIERSQLDSGDAVKMGAVTVVLSVDSASDEGPRPIDGYDLFAKELEREVHRAKAYGRQLCLLMVRMAGDGAYEHHVLNDIQSRLRPVDRIGIYGPSTVLIALPETGIERAKVLANELTTQGDLEIGIAEWPGTAHSAQELVSSASKALRMATPASPVVTAQPEEAKSPMIFTSDSMRKLVQTAVKVARLPTSVLIVGETGTGKELIAQAIHSNSDREGKLHTVNCAAIPESLMEATFFGHERGAFSGALDRRPGVFEQAKGGTIFLDEIGELSPSAQAALLRVLETKRLRRVGGEQEIEIDVRVLAATHRDLEKMRNQGAFRPDLLYRLNAIVLDVPPLRARPDDIQPLAEHFVTEASRTSLVEPKSLDSLALRALCYYDWPGNVRELRNVIDRAAVLSDGASIHIDDLPEMLRTELDDEEMPTIAHNSLKTMALKEKVSRYERRLIIEALEQSGGNQTSAAKSLQLPLRTLAYKMNKHGISRKDIGKGMSTLPMIS